MNGTFRSGAARLLVAVTAGTAAAAFGTGCTPSDSSAAGGRGGALTVAMSKPAGNLDPHKYDAVWTVQSMVFEPLVRYAADGGIRPALAASYDVSKDGTVYTFRLRPGVTFSDGTRWDARAAKFNLDRWTTLEDSKWMGAALYFKRLRVVDDMTIEYALTRPYPQLLQELTAVRPVRFLSPASAGTDGAASTLGARSPSPSARKRPRPW